MAHFRRLGHRIWTAIYRVSAFVLICCMVPIVGFPYTVGYSWVYWVALGSAVTCGAAAAVLRKLEGDEASGEAAWLLGKRGHGSKDLLDIDADD